MHKGFSLICDQSYWAEIVFGLITRSEEAKKQSWCRWCGFGIFVFFILIHKSTKLVIGSFVTQIIKTTNTDLAQMGCTILILLLAGFIAWDLTVQLAIYSVYTSAWALVTGSLTFTAYLLPHDVSILRAQRVFWMK
jgi:hypothetical protein